MPYLTLIGPKIWFKYSKYERVCKWNDDDTDHTETIIIYNIITLLPLYLACNVKFCMTHLIP